MGRFLLAGDIGGTKAVLALVAPDGAVVRESTFASRSYARFEELAAEFLRGTRVPVSHACFSVAGPVTDGRVWFPNLGWRLDAGELRDTLGLTRVRLLNDLQATALAVPHLAPAQLSTLQEGAARPDAVRAVIAPGTGLGEALLVPRDGGHEALATESGHADFAPTDAQQRRLLEFLHRDFDQISYERVCSGQGIPHLYRFVRAESGAPEPEWLSRELAAAEDPTPVLVAAGLSAQRRCDVCARALDLFAAILGAEAGNLALRALALGGVYLGGGLPPRLLPLLRGEGFLRAFRRKGPMSELVSRVPVRVILDPRAALLGAVGFALRAEAAAPPPVRRPPAPPLSAR